jgi:lipid II:glycine glycyltransferase (peptidoglycan interpeptide bridge formation enzyme)
MLLTGERDNFAIRSTEYFERIMDAFGDDARIYFAYYEDELLAGALDVHVGDKILYVYGASSNEHRNLMPTYLVQWYCIKWAIEEGCNWYDFRGGYPDENNPLHGIYKFKKGFCNDYMEFMGEADLIMDKIGFKAVEAAQKLSKSTRKIRSKLLK